MAESETSEQSDSPKLARTMGLWALVIYGVGDMVGSGIYGTIGAAAKELGNAAWLAFVVSMIAAMLTGLSYASLASRYPRAAGAAYITHRAYGFTFLSYFVGLAVAASGLTSMATSTNVFSGVMADLIGLSGQLGRLTIPIGSWKIVDHDIGVVIVIFAFLAFMTIVNIRGIRESMWTNLICTTIEVGGLIFIIAIGARYWGSVNYLQPPAEKTLGPLMLLSGAVLTFFSFVGFEDMLNVAEEVKDPQRTMPWGIIFALATVTVLYIAISITAVSVVESTELAAARAPLAAITARAAAWLPPWVFQCITMFAVANTVLINYIMGSRLLYGMARQGLVPAVLGRVHHTRQTPHIAILTLLCIVSVLAMLGGVGDLATTTGLLLLGCFVLVNGSLILLKLRPSEPKGHFEVPLFVPVLAIVVNLSLIAARLWSFLHDPKVGARPIWIALGLAVVIILLYVIMRPKHIAEDT